MDERKRTGDMKKAKVAFLLNALVMPGAGHIYLGYRLRGAVIAIICTVFVIAPLAKYAVLMTSLISFSTHMGSPGEFSDFFYASTGIWPEMRKVIIFSAAGLLATWIYGTVDILRRKNR